MTDLLRSLNVQALEEFAEDPTADFEAQSFAKQPAQLETPPLKDQKRSADSEEEQWPMWKKIIVAGIVALTVVFFVYMIYKKVKLRKEMNKRMSQCPLEPSEEEKPLLSPKPPAPTTEILSAKLEELQQARQQSAASKLVETIKELSKEDDSSSSDSEESQKDETEDEAEEHESEDNAAEEENSEKEQSDDEDTDFENANRFESFRDRFLEENQPEEGNDEEESHLNIDVE